MPQASKYTPIQAERLYERIVEQVEQKILSGDLKVGDRLPPERELADQFGVSRTAVREAVKALRQKGLVEVQPGRGTFITNGTSRAMRHSLDLLTRIGRVDGSANLVEVREIIEPEIAVLAAARATEEHIAAMREAVETMEVALEDPDRFIEADLDFHLALAEATQNALIPALIDSIVDLLREQRARIFHVQGGPQRGQFHHKRILDAIVRRDPEAAQEAMRAHLQQVREDSGASAAPAD
ncbi:MAG TPA: FadR/GntR family transcriptional regulator [Anaerolineae bacterium]|nr:FadR/GntR family transcriptional regulator [Anaerolineae bacterium]